MRRRSAVLLTASLLAVVPVVPAHAATTLSVTPLTWNVLGLDSNAPADGPNRYPVGARVCNTGGETASSVVARLVFTTASTAIVASGPTQLAKGNLPPGRCVDAYFEVRVAAVASSYGATRGFRITASSANSGTASTPSPRELVVVRLISQNRNDVLSITGPTTVFVGQTYTFTLLSETAPSGYEQLESHLTFPPQTLELLSVSTRYSFPSGATNDTVYGDACGWDDVPTSASYLTCVGPVGYPGGKVGGTISTTYTVRVVSAGTASLSGLIYDKSGASYHYNADYDTAGNRLVVTAVEPPDLALTKTHVGTAWPVGTEQTWTVQVRNVGGWPTTGTTTVTDTLPAGITPVSAAGPGWTCSISGQTVTCRLASSLAAGAASSITIRVLVGAGAPGTVVNVARVTTPNDGDPANDTGRDTATVTRPTTTPPTTPTGTSGGGGTGGGGTGGTPPGSPTGSPGGGTASPVNGSPGGAPVAGRPGTGTGVAGPGLVGGLPNTGAPVDVAVRLALQLLFAGAFAVWAGRRSRPLPARVHQRVCLAHGGE